MYRSLALDKKGPYAKRKRRVVVPLLFCFFSGILSSVSLANELTPSGLLRQVLNQNPELASQKAKADAEKEAISSSASLSNPKIGFMKESNMNFMQEQRGAMNSWMISQEIMFPTKYFSMGSMQSSKAKAAWQEYLDKSLDIRQRTLSAYFSYYSAQKILSLLGAQKETLREVARIAESRRATGAVPQQDEMKAHVEQTLLENELLLQNHEVVETLAMLNELLNRDPGDEIDLPKDELKSPKLLSLDKIEQLALENSKMVAGQKFMLEEALTNKSIAKQSYLPDFMLSYRRPFGASAMDNSYAFAVEMTIPLWFFSKQTSDVSAASARSMMAEKRLEQTQRMTSAQARTLTSKAQTLSKQLDIFETALIPQATSTLNSSRAAYNAGKIGFQDLLDSERSLYSVRIDYYRTLSKLVEAVTSLERIVGKQLSDLPFDGGETP